MAKQDPSLHEEQDRNSNSTTTHQTDNISDRPQTPGRTDAAPHTEVKNAHAAGDGAMGKNDEEVVEEEEPLK